MSISHPVSMVEILTTYLCCLLQSDLQQSVSNEEKLRQSQAEEMEEVENYVEHIRNLSDERETLIQQLETENDQLKSDIEALRQEVNSMYPSHCLCVG